MMENALFESHFDLIPFGIYVVEVATYRLIYSNRAFIERFGKQNGKVCHQVLYERDTPCLDCRMAELFTEAGLPRGETLVYEHFNERDDRWYQMQTRAMTWPDGRVVRYAIAVDISELKDTQNRLAEAHARLALQNIELVRLSITDVLTGLANRQHIEKLLGQGLEARAASGGAYSLIMLDIDHFKRINDTLGHLRGDEALRALAGLLQRSVPVGCHAGRWGGEEFLVCCPDMSLAQTSLLAESLRGAVAALDVAGVTRLTCSFGVVESHPAEGPDSLVARADQALYAAKELGRDRVEAA